MELLTRVNEERGREKGNTKRTEDKTTGKTSKIGEI